MTDVSNQDGLKVENVQGANEANVNLTLAEGKAAQPVDPNTPSAEGLGVTDEQFSKYFDAEKGYNWQAHAKEAEFKVAQKDQPDDKTADTQDDVPKSADAPTDDEAQTLVEKAGLNFTDLENKIVADGDIGKEDYDALKSIGIPEDVVSDYITGIKDRVSSHVANVISAFGGEENYNKISDFAQANYTPEEIAALETQLADPKQYKLATDLLLTKSGLPPVENSPALSGPNEANPGPDQVQPYANQAEMVAAMRDSRYKTDPAFRGEVEKRAGASTFGTNPRAHTSGL